MVGLLSENKDEGKKKKEVKNMGFLEILKTITKNKNENNVKLDISFNETINGKTKKVNTNNIENEEEISDIEYLKKYNDLPYGWIFKNNQSISEIGSGYSYFFDQWIQAQKKSPKELYPALKSFVVYLEDAERISKIKGECFIFWFYEFVASKDYIQERKKELEYLTANFDYLQDIYIKKQNLKPAIITLLKNNDGILQSEFKNLFDEPFHSEVSNILYQMHQNGEVEKIKSGRSYILHYKGSE